MHRDGAQYMDCKSLRSPTAGEISPSRFRPDRLLQNKKKKKREIEIKI